MAEETSLESTVNQLTKRIDDQARFTRTVVVVCATAVLGVMFYMLTILFSDLPYMFVARYMENLESIVRQWRAIDALENQRRAGGGAPGSKAPEKSESPAPAK
ncbi:MAG TPA: hypothetical protein V6D08_10225 [Candidatus Obscuribacterales bacterium]